MQIKQRDPFFDNAKFFLIFLVILGHMLSIDHGQYKINRASGEWIFSFHMPLFIFISGYFTKIIDKKRHWSSIINFTETLFVFTLLHILIEYLQGKTINDYRLLIYPKWTLWYLFSLIWWRIMLYYTPPPIRNNNYVLIITSVILSISMGFIPIDSQFSFQRTFAFFPFFIIGYIVGKNQIKIISKKSKNYKILIFAFILVSIWVFYFIVPKNNIKFLFQNTCFYHGPLSAPILNLTFRIGMLFLASFMSYCFLSLIPRKKYRWTHFGQITLFIYLYHSIILSWCSNICDKLHLPTHLFFCILYSAIVLGIIWLMSKVRFFHWLLNPISSTIKNRL